MNDPSELEGMQYVMAMGGCCLFFGLLGVVGTLMWWLRGPSKSPGATPQVAPLASTAASFHISVVGIAVSAAHRAVLERSMTRTTNIDPATVRVDRLTHVASTLLSLEPSWALFGYGESDRPTFSEFQRSYQEALTDFRARASQPGDEGPLVVLVMVLGTRGPRLGVDRLDTRAQVRELLGDRLTIDVSSLLAAELFWAPELGSLTELEVQRRFPEMHPLTL